MKLIPGEGLKRSSDVNWSRSDQPRMKLIPGEGLKLCDQTTSNTSSQPAPNEANPWRGIETRIEGGQPGRLTPSPNEANPWRGIETVKTVDERSSMAPAPNEANPWRGIETHIASGRSPDMRYRPRMKLIPGEGLKHYLHSVSYRFLLHCPE